MSDTQPDPHRMVGSRDGLWAHQADVHPYPNGNGQNGNGYAQQAELHPLRDMGGVECRPSIELVIFRFSSFGRLAHVRRWLQSLPHVSSVRIAGYVNQTALFSVGVTPGTTSRALVPPGTRLISSDGRRLELSVGRT